MAYADRFGRGYLTGFNSIEATGTITATGAITSSGVVTGTRLKASTAGAVATPALEIVSGANSFGWYEVGSALVAAVAGSARGQFSASGMASLNGPLITATFVEYPQIAEPSAPSAGVTRVWGADNGGSKTQLRARFDSGASQAMATEP